MDYVYTTTQSMIVYCAAHLSNVPYLWLELALAEKHKQDDQDSRDSSEDGGLGGGAA